MKTVMSSDMIAHTWAHQSQDAARNASGSMSFRGRTLYSYSTPIAQLHTGKDGRPVALITSRKYSITTSSKHMPAAYGAVRHLRAFTVPALGCSGGRHCEPGNGSVESMHEHNCAYLGAQYNETANRLRRARDVYSFDSLLCAAEQHRWYCEAFGLPVPRLMSIDMVNDHIGEIRRYREDRYAARNTPEQRAKRERERERREARKAEKEERERAARAEALRDVMAAWRAGNVYANHSLYGLPCMLRMKPGTDDTVQTSQGAEVPEAHARRVYGYAMRIRAGGMAWTREGANAIFREQYTLGAFTLDAVDPDGIRAGCHNISWAEIDTFAAARGWRV